MRRIFFTTFSLSLSLMMFSSVWAQSHNDYFDMLAARPDVLLANALRSQAEVDAVAHGSQNATVYDPVMDAAKFTIPPGNGIKDIRPPLADQLRTEFPSPRKGMSSGNLLFFVETLHEDGFVADGEPYGLQGHKSFNIRSTRSKPAFGPRHFYKYVDPPYVAYVDVKPFGGQVGYTTGGFERLEPQTDDFWLLPWVWTRYWFFLDLDNDTFTYWIGDENRENVAIHDAVPFDYDGNWAGEKWEGFWVQWDSSSVSLLGSPALHIWTRNIVVLEDLPGGQAEAASLAAQGEMGAGGVGGDVIPPASPQNLNVQ